MFFSFIFFSLAATTIYFMVMKRIILSLLLSTSLLLNSCISQSIVNNRLITAKKSFIKIETWIQGCFEGVCSEYSLFSYGSGFVHTKKGSSYVITAEHVCVPSDRLDTASSKINVRHMLIDVNKQKYKAHIVKSNKDLDICLMKFEEDPGMPGLKLSKRKPQYTEKIYNISSPLGVSDGEMVPAFEGMYIGSSEGSDFYSMPTSPGASGSPIINTNGEVVGVVLAVHRHFHHITLSIEFKNLWNYLIL
tara:strand:- start:2832 stop:3575 length:744 start_codon:yes stop_codon:yes gene_type:complete